MIYSWPDNPRNQAFDPGRADLSLFQLRDSSSLDIVAHRFAIGRYHVGLRIDDVRLAATD
jgi:hypothetical protein